MKRAHLQVVQHKFHQIMLKEQKLEQELVELFELFDWFDWFEWWNFTNMQVMPSSKKILLLIRSMLIRKKRQLRQSSKFRNLKLSKKNQKWEKGLVIWLLRELLFWSLQWCFQFLFSCWQHIEKRTKVLNLG